tara:strand:+ start:1062 stop:1586 length:525 start_codon:yes stop_codon:yes gene_type:complete
MEGSMSEESKPVANETVSEEATNEVSTNSTDVGALIAESKKYRKRSQDAEARLAKLESQLAKAEEAKLKEKEDFKTLYEQNKEKMKSLTDNADKWAKYEADKRESLLKSVPEDERESLVNLPFETLEYVTNKINSVKPNMPEVVGNPREIKPEKAYKDMSYEERKVYHREQFGN